MQSFNERVRVLVCLCDGVLLSLVQQQNVDSILCGEQDSLTCCGSSH